VRLSFLSTLIGAALLATVTSASATTTVALDPDHTSVQFTVTHLLISRVSGSIPLATSRLVIDSHHTPLAAKATFNLRGITTEDARRDADLRGDKWFDVAEYPTMSFRSTTIVPGAGHTFTLRGLLTLHGTTAPIVLHGLYTGKARDPYGHVHLGYSASGQLNRTTWGIGHVPAALVSEKVDLTIQAEAIEK